MAGEKRLAANEHGTPNPRFGHEVDARRFAQGEVDGSDLFIQWEDAALLVLD